MFDVHVATRIKAHARMRTERARCRGRLLEQGGTETPVIRTVISVRRIVVSAVSIQLEYSYGVIFVVQL